MEVNHKPDWMNILTAGGVSGLGLAFFLWVAERVSEELVFVLLLNVDFIPLIGAVKWPVLIELLFHLIISWVIAFGYLSFFYKKNRTNRQRWYAALFLSIGAGFTYFPLSILAIRPVPSPDNITAILYWFSGHLLYAVLLKKTSGLREG